ncbi:MAG: thioredoxin family protein [Bacteroidia bacterium]
MKYLLTAIFVWAQGYKVGDSVKDFSLKNVDGKMVSLSDHVKEKGVIVIFTCNHCPFAKAYEQRIIELDKKYRPKGFPVLAINPNDPEAYPEDSYPMMQKRAKEKNYPFPYLWDETQEVALTFGAARTPQVYLLHQEKDSWRVAYIGAIDNNDRDPKRVTRRYVEEAIEALSQGKPIPISETKAVGCSIKYRKKTN